MVCEEDGGVMCEEDGERLRGYRDSKSEWARIEQMEYNVEYVK